MNFYALITILLFSVSTPFTAKADDATFRQPWFTKYDCETTEITFETAKIVAVKPLKASLEDIGKNPSGTTIGLSVVTFENGVKAVWKPGEENLAEVAGYKAARLVGSSLVPPTVERILDQAAFGPDVPQKTVSEMIGKVGSLQLFVKTPYDITDSKVRAEIWPTVPSTQKAERDIFNFVFGNWDLHWGNVLVDAAHSLVQIDNGAILRRQMVRYGELPFIRRLEFAHGLENERKSEGPFPFEKAVSLERPSITQVISLLRDYADPNELANYVRTRLKKFKSSELTTDVVDGLLTLVRNHATIQEIDDYVQGHESAFKPSNLTMKVVFWDNGIWIQAIGFQNYGPIVPTVFPEWILSGYQKLTFESLRALFPEEIFSNKALNEILSRRDQLLRAAERAGTIKVEP